MLAPDDEVRCPTCGRFFQLGECPIVERSEAEAASAPRREGLAGLAEVAAAQGRSDRPSGLQPGGELRSKYDEKWRTIVAPPPGVDGDELRTATRWAQLYGFSEGRAARACPNCHHPLPSRIDREPVFTAVLLGHVASGKTATVLAVHQHDREKGEPFSANIGGIDRDTQLVADQMVEPDLRARDPEIFERYNDRATLGDGARLARTEDVWLPALDFWAAITAGARFGIRLVDRSGEALENPSRRWNVVRDLVWARALIFLFDPADEYNAQDPDVQRKQTSQAAMLTGVIEDLEESADLDAYPPHLIIAVSKADLIDGLTKTRVDQRQYTDAAVQDVLRVHGAASVVQAAGRWPGGATRVHWRFIAPMPRKSTTWGIKHLVDKLLTVCAEAVDER